MKVVIDIDKEYYQILQYEVEIGHNGYKPIVLIAKGKPLPKGHGRIGDLSKIYVELNEAQIEGTEEYKGLGEAKQMICDAPTIIEAESEE